MTKYFDANTGQVLDDETDPEIVNARLAQRVSIVAVTGRALEVVEAGNDSVGDPDEVPDVARPEAAESSEDAQKAFEEEEKARAEQHDANLMAHGSGVAPDDEEDEAKPDDARQARRAKAKSEAGASKA